MDRIPMRLLAAVIFLAGISFEAAEGWSWIDCDIPGLGEEPIRTNCSIRLGAYMWIYPNWTDREIIQFAAENFDIFSVKHLPVFRNSTSIGMLRSTNPSICLLLTFCPIILDESDDWYLNVGGWREEMHDWVLRLSNGSEAPNRLWSFTNTHVMDIGNPLWAAYFRDRANAWVRRLGVDGYFLDGVPWNGVYYPDAADLLGYSSRDEINSAIIRFLDVVRQPHLCLVLDDVTEPWQQEHLDGVWGEDWLGYDPTVPWGQKDTSQWEEAVERLELYSSQMKPYLAQGWYHYGREWELEYLASTYLLAKKSNSAAFQPCPIGSPSLPPGAAYDYSSYDADVYRRELDEHGSIFNVKLGVHLAGG